MQLGDFEIEGELGGGGLGEVIAARMRVGGRRVALKKPKAGAENEAARLRDEGRLGLRLNGTAFVETLGAFEADGVPYVALERIEGVTVFELWRTTGALPWPAVARIGAEVCQALAVMHVLRDENGDPMNAIHRDISGRNVMVDADGKVRVIDLGASIVSTERSAVSKTGMVIGTLPYLPPEVFEGGKDSPARDLWAVGVMLLEASVGDAYVKRRRGESDTDGLRRVRGRSLDPFAAPEVQAIEPRLLGILKQLLTRDPVMRMDAKTAGAELAALCAGTNAQKELAARVSRTRALPKPMPKTEIVAVKQDDPTAVGRQRTEAATRAEVGFGEDGPTVVDPPRAAGSLGVSADGPTVVNAGARAPNDLGADGPTRRDTVGRSPAGVQLAPDAPSGVARPWPASPPPPPPMTEETFLRALTLPPSGESVFTSVPVAASEAPSRAEPEDVAFVSEAVRTPAFSIESQSSVRLFPWKAALVVVATFAGLISILWQLTH